MTWPAWGLGMGAPRASPSGVLESEVLVLGSPWKSLWAFLGEQETGKFLGRESSRGVVSTLSPLCWLPARNEKGKASHPKK